MLFKTLLIVPGIYTPCPPSPPPPPPPPPRHETLFLQSNARVINKFCGERDWIRNLAQDPATASNTSVCLTLDLDKAQVRVMVNVRVAIGARVGKRVTYISFCVF